MFSTNPSVSSNFFNICPCIASYLIVFFVFCFYNLFIMRDSIDCFSLINYVLDIKMSLFTPPFNEIIRIYDFILWFLAAKNLSKYFSFVALHSNILDKSRVPCVTPLKFQRLKTQIAHSACSDSP